LLILILDITIFRSAVVFFAFFPMFHGKSEFGLDLSLQSTAFAGETAREQHEYRYKNKSFGRFVNPPGC
jgi:hypothetical protein